MSHSVQAIVVTVACMATAQLPAIYKWQLELCLAGLLFMLNTDHCLLHVSQR